MNVRMSGAHYFWRIKKNKIIIKNIQQLNQVSISEYMAIRLNVCLFNGILGFNVYWENKFANHFVEFIKSRQNYKILMNLNPDGVLNLSLTNSKSLHRTQRFLIQEQKTGNSSLNFVWYSILFQSSSNKSITALLDSFHVSSSLFFA